MNKWRLLYGKICQLPLWLLIAQAILAQPTAGNPSGQNPFPASASTPSTLRMNEISARAARHFSAHFSGAGKEKWTIIDGFYVASLTDGQESLKAFYNSRGSFAYCMRNYPGNLLNEEIKIAIGKKYGYNQIDVVTEISNLDEVLYYVKIRTREFIKTLKILRGTMEVAEEFGNQGF